MANVASQLRTQMNTIANGEPIPIIIRRKRDSLSPKNAEVAAGQADQTFRLFPGEVVKVASSDIETLSQQDDIEDIWPDLPVQTCLDSSVPKVMAPQVWDLGFKGTGISVAILDTGLDDTHPDFGGRIKVMKSFVSPTARDDNGHGTHVAGIVAGSGARSIGKYIGVAPEADLYIAKVLRANGGGSMSNVMAAIEWAVLEQKVQVINLSLGSTTTCDGTDALSAMCDEAVLQSEVVICVAAGNAGPTIQTIGTPGCARYVITVGAITDNGRLAKFSSRGPTADGRIKPDIVFPGIGVVAPQAAGTKLGAVVDEGYVTSDGTSMAAPHAAGVAALMLQANPNLTAEQVKNQMVAGGVNLGLLPNEQGIGRGDAYRAYFKAIGQPVPAVASPSSAPSTTTLPPAQSQPQPEGCLAMLTNLFGKQQS